MSIVIVSQDKGYRSVDHSRFASTRGYPRGSDGWEGLDVETGTPVIRFDLTDFHTALTLSVTGPMRGDDLPRGTVSRVLGPAIQDANPGDTFGPLDYVSTDLYLAGVTAAGVPVQVWPDVTPIR